MILLVRQGRRANGNLAGLVASTWAASEKTIPHRKERLCAGCMARLKHIPAARGLGTSLVWAAEVWYNRLVKGGSTEAGQP